MNNILLNSTVIAAFVTVLVKFVCDGIVQLLANKDVWLEEKKIDIKAIKRKIIEAEENEKVYYEIVSFGFPKNVLIARFLKDIWDKKVLSYCEGAIKEENICNILQGLEETIDAIDFFMGRRFDKTLGRVFDIVFTPIITIEFVNAIMVTYKTNRIEDNIISVVLAIMMNCLLVLILWLLFKRVMLSMQTLSVQRYCLCETMAKILNAIILYGLVYKELIEFKVKNTLWSSALLVTLFMYLTVRIMIIEIDEERMYGLLTD